LATLTRAQEAFRASNKAGLNRPVEVIIGEGNHRLAEPLVLGPEDSETESAPITWQAKGRVILSGGRVITGCRETTPNGNTD